MDEIDKWVADAGFGLMVDSDGVLSIVYDTDDGETRMAVRMTEVQARCLSAMIDAVLA